MSALSPIFLMLNRAVATTGLKREDIYHALNVAIEEAVCTYFDVEECEVNLRYGTVYPVFHFPGNMALEEAELFKPNVVYNDLIYPEISFEMLHSDILRQSQELFNRNLRIIQEQHLYKKWKVLKHRVVEGYIDTAHANKIEIDLGTEGVRGIMYKSEWVPSEVSMYKPGKLLKFYVVKVQRYKSLVSVYLSRGTPSFPIALIREKIHGPKIKILKRLRGIKSWISSNVQIPVSVLEEVRKELRGERLEIKVEGYGYREQNSRYPQEI